MRCTYCGAPADTLDHIIPRSFACNFKRGSKPGNDPGETVPACRECNGLLGNKLFPTLRERGAYILKTLPVRYKKLLSRPQWTDEELADIGPSLRTTILNEAKEAVLVKDRIAFAAEFYK